MFKHILMPTDGSELAAKAIGPGIEFARAAHAKVTLFTAVPEYKAPSEVGIIARQMGSLWDHERVSRDTAEAVLKPAAERMLAAGVRCEMAYAESNHPYQAIVDAAKSRGCDLILMSAHARQGLSDLWHGSQTRGVLAHSRIPTLVYR